MSPAVEFVVHGLERGDQDFEPLGLAQGGERVGRVEEGLGGDEQIVGGPLGVERAGRDRGVAARGQQLRAAEDHVGARRAGRQVLKPEPVFGGGLLDHDVGEPGRVQGVSQVVSANRVGRETVGLDLVLTRGVAAVAGEDAGQRAVAAPVGRVEPVEREPRDGVAERIGRTGAGLSPQAHAVRPPLAEGRRRERGAQPLGLLPRPLHRVRHRGELAGSVLDLAPRPVGLGLPPLEGDAEVHVARRVEMIELEQEAVRARIVLGHFGPVELVGIGVGREVHVGEIALPALRPRVGSEHRRSAAPPPGTEPDPRAGAPGQACHVHHLAVAPGSLRHRGARARRPARDPHDDPVAGVEDAVPVHSLLDFDRQLDRGVGGRVVAGEFVAVDADLADRHAGREALVLELGVLDPVDPARIELHPHFGLALVERRAPEPGSERALEQRAALRDRGEPARGRSPAPPLLVVDQRAPEHRLPVAVLGARGAAVRWRPAREAHAHRDRAARPQPPGRLIVTERPDLDRDQALMARLEGLAQLHRRPRPGTVGDRRGGLARGNDPEPARVVAESRPVPDRELDALARLLRAGLDRGARARAGRNREQRVGVGEPRPPGLVQERQPRARHLGAAIRAWIEREGSRQIEAERHAPLVGGDEPDSGRRRRGTGGGRGHGDGGDQGEEQQEGNERARARGKRHRTTSLMR